MNLSCRSPVDIFLCCSGVDCISALFFEAGVQPVSALDQPVVFGEL